MEWVQLVSWVVCLTFTFSGLISLPIAWWLADKIAAQRAELIMLQESFKARVPSQWFFYDGSGRV